MFRKAISLAIVCMFIFTTIVSAQVAPENTLIDKVSAVEKTLYGNDQTGSLLERISKLETDLYGTAASGAVVTRADSLYNGFFDSSASAPSILTKINGIEWELNHKVTSLPVKERIEKLEGLIDGISQTGAYNERINKLAKLAFANGTVIVADKVVPADTLVKIKLTSTIDSKTARIGDVVTYQVAEDVLVDGVLVLAKGADGIGQVTKVSQAQNFGRDAKLEIDFTSIKAIDGSTITTFLGEKSKKETQSITMAAGASVAGLAILGPVGIVGGVFVKGKSAKIDEGAQLYIQTKLENVVHGVQAQAS